jgi:hypothetical protein
MMLHQTLSVFRSALYRIWGIDPEIPPTSNPIAPARIAVRLSSPSARTSVPIIPRRTKHLD